MQTIDSTTGPVVIDAFNQLENLAVLKARAVKDTNTSMGRIFTYTQAQVRPVSANKTGPVPAGTQIELSTPTEGAAITYILTRRAGEAGENVDA